MTLTLLKTCVELGGGVKTAGPLPDVAELNFFLFLFLYFHAILKGGGEGDS